MGVFVRRSSVDIHRCWVRAPFHQSAHGLHVSMLRGEMEGCLGGFVTRVDRGAFVDQLLCRGEVAFGRGLVERCRHAARRLGIGRRHES